MLYISRLTADSPYTITFSSDKFAITHRSTGKLVGQGSKVGNVSRLETYKDVAFFSNKHQAADFALWHSRLGHCSNNIVKLLQARQQIVACNNSIPSCVYEACQLGKSKKLPFCDSVNHALHVFDEIHCDLWGPAPIASWNNFKYYTLTLLMTIQGLFGIIH